MKMEKNKSQKWIVVLLAFIAMCMVCIIVLLATNILKSTDKKNDTAEKEVNEQVVDTKKKPDEQVTDTKEKKNDEESNDEEFKNGYVTIKGEKHPLYLWNDELADEPITPTEVEETWILEGMNTTKYPDMSEQLETAILEHAKNYECYENPTVVNCMVYPQNINAYEAIMVDFRTKEHSMETFMYDPVADEVKCAAWTMDFDKVKPYRSEDGKYIFNANNLYTYNESEEFGYTDEELVTMQKKVLEAAKQRLIRNGMYDEYYASINNYVLSTMDIEDRENMVLNLYTTLKDGKNFNLYIGCSFDDENYY